MKHHTLIVGTAALLISSLTGCKTPRSGFVFPIQPRKIHTATAEDGATESWAVAGGNTSYLPRLVAATSRNTEVARLGVRIRLKKVLGGNRMGLEITEVTPSSAAADAELRPGDVLLAIDGQPLETRYALRDYLANFDQPARKVTLSVLAQGDTTNTPRTLTARTQAVAVAETDEQSIELHHSAGVQHYTGLQAATLSAEHAKAIYGVDTPVLFVTGVVGGSPAYFAGLRAGDRVLSVDGGPASLDELRVAVFDRLDYLTPPMDLLMFDHNGVYENSSVPRDSYGVCAELQWNDERVSEDAPLTLEVDGPLGRHRAIVPLVQQGVDTVTEADLPGVWTSTSGIRGTGMQFLDPGFTIGFDYRSYAGDSETRDPVESLSLDLLPFGMFQVKSFPASDRDEVTLFWFLTI